MASVRYVRSSANGSTSNSGTHLVEIEVYSSSTNVALNKTVTANLDAINGSLAAIVNGVTSSSDYRGVDNPAGWIVTVDLGQEYDIEEIRIYRYGSDSRSYYNDQVEVSVDNSTWTTVGGPQTQQYPGDGTYWSITDFSALGGSSDSPESYSITGLTPTFAKDFNDSDVTTSSSDVTLVGSLTIVDENANAPTSYAAGGITSQITYNGTLHNVHVFKESGSFSVTDAVNANVLVVGGGGGGGSHVPGGGGAGGLVYRPGLPITGGATYNITVGEGGTGSYNPGNYGGMPNATRGGDSSFDTLLTALGGGFGDSWNQDGRSNDGGSGGGAHTSNGTPGVGLQPSQSGDSGTYGFGNSGGGASYGNPYPGSGGGGAGEPGFNAPSGSVAGAGGDGKYYGDVFGDEYGDAGWFAGGGGGGAWGNVGVANIGAGGQGGGGSGDAPNGSSGNGNSLRLGSGEPTGENGQPNTGGGGGGAGRTGAQSSRGGDGGSGIVILSYPTGNIAFFDGTLPIYASGFSATNHYELSSLNSAGAAKLHSFIIWYKGTQSDTNADGQVAIPLFGNKNASGGLTLGIDNGKIAISDGTTIYRGTTDVNTDELVPIIFTVGETMVRAYVNGNLEINQSSLENTINNSTINCIGHAFGTTAWPTAIDGIQIYDTFLVGPMVADFQAGISGSTSTALDSFITDTLVLLDDARDEAGPVVDPKPITMYVSQTNTGDTLDYVVRVVDPDFPYRTVLSTKVLGFGEEATVNATMLSEDYMLVNKPQLEGEEQDELKHRLRTLRIFYQDKITKEKWS